MAHAPFTPPTPGRHAMTAMRGLNRRRLLAASPWALAGALASLSSRTLAHSAMGPVSPPAHLPKMRLTNHEGQTRTWQAWTQGHWTAVQTIFTGCSSICPLQGALFAQLQTLWHGQVSEAPTPHAASAPSLPAAAHTWQLLSLSIDPLGDTPAALQAWRRHWQANSTWVALLPAMKDLDALLSVLHGSPPLKGELPGTEAAGHHPAKVFILDEQGALRWRSPVWPTTAMVTNAMTALSAQRPAAADR